jgi:hypothetical protein
MLYMQSNAVIETRRSAQQVLKVVCALLGQAPSAVPRDVEASSGIDLFSVETSVKS